MPYQGTLEDDFPFPQVGYVSSLEGNSITEPRIIRDSTTSHTTRPWDFVEWMKVVSKMSISPSFQYFSFPGAALKKIYIYKKWMFNLYCQSFRIKKRYNLYKQVFERGVNPSDSVEEMKWGMKNIKWEAPYFEKKQVLHLPFSWGTTETATSPLLILLCICTRTACLWDLNHISHVSKSSLRSKLRYRKMTLQDTLQYPKVTPLLNTTWYASCQTVRSDSPRSQQWWNSCLLQAPKPATQQQLRSKTASLPLKRNHPNVWKCHLPVPSWLSGA